MQQVTATPSPDRHPDDLLPTYQAAADYHLSRSWFAQSRLRGDGPEFIRAGLKKVLYRRSAIEAYLAGRVLKSTSQKIA